MKSYFKTFFSGFFMGSADLVPGVSGGTIAFILGIYSELVQTIASINKQLIIKFISFKWGWILKNFNWKFLIVLFAGIFTAILTLAHFLELALQNYPMYVWAFFTGLVLASVPTIVKKVKGKWDAKLISLFIFGVIIALVVVNLTPAQTPNSPLFLFLCGAMASMAMILPGISGSFILVLLGKYKYILSAVNDKDLFTIALVGTGAALGIIIFSKVINYFLHKYHDISVAILGGFVLGAVSKIWPFKVEIPKKNFCSYVETFTTCVPRYKNTLPNLSNLHTLVALGFIILGAITILLITKLAKKSGKQ